MSRIGFSRSKFGSASIAGVIPPRTWCVPMPGMYEVTMRQPSASAAAAVGHCTAYFLARSNCADIALQSAYDNGALCVPAYQSTVPTAGPWVTGISSVDVHHHGTGPPACSASTAPW